MSDEIAKFMHGVPPPLLKTREPYLSPSNGNFTASPPSLNKTMILERVVLRPLNSQKGKITIDSPLQNFRLEPSPENVPLSERNPLSWWFLAPRPKPYWDRVVPDLTGQRRHLASGEQRHLSQWLLHPGKSDPLGPRPMVE